MTIPAAHKHISEREADGTWEDCTWCTILEWFRLVLDASKPATLAEAEDIRKASGKGPTGGSNYDDAARGIKARYNYTLPARLTSFTALKAALTPGKVAAISGSMKAFGPTDPLSKWDPKFDGGHAVLLMNIGGTLYWCDPEAPTTAAVPVVITWTKVKAFVTAFNGKHVVGTIKVAAPAPTPTPVPTQEAIVPLTSYLPGYTADVKSGSNIRTEPRIAASKLTTTTKNIPVQVVGTVEGDKDPANGSTVWYELFYSGRSAFTAKDNIINLKAPVTAPSYPDVRAELAAVVASIPGKEAVANKAGKAEQYKAAIGALTKLIPEL